MSDLLDLAKRCERAEGPSFDLDKAILAALGFTWRGMNYWSSDKMWKGPSNFTSSLDAAAYLIPDGFDWILERVNDGLTIGARVGHNDPDRTSWGDTPALALTAAALRSIAAVKGAPDHG
jgi:hypothetical protein